MQLPGTSLNLCMRPSSPCPQVNESLVRCLAVTAPMPEEKLQVRVWVVCSGRTVMLCVAAAAAVGTAKRSGTRMSCPSSSKAPPTPPPPTLPPQFLESIAEEHDVEFDREKAAQDMLPGAPVAPYAAPVQTIAAAGLSGQGPGQALPLAQGWQPPAAGVPPDAAPQAQPGWQPPPAGLPAGDAAAQEHYARVLSGGTVWHRAGEVGSPGATAQPSAADAAKPGGQGWQPPKPEDFDQPGRAFQSHVGAAAAWRQTKLHGPSPNTSGETPNLDYPPPAAGLADLPGTAQSSGGSTPSMSEKPPTPASTYVDATAAAEAAKQYSQLAAQAAQRAEQFAAAQAVRHGGGGSGGPSPGPSPGPGSPGPGSGGAGGGGGAADKGKGPSPFVERSFEEIQRAYDAAPGPPSKFDKMGGSAAPSAPPSAPPAADAAGTSAAGGSDGPATAGLGGTPDGEDGGLPDLPSVPAAGVPPPPGVGDELDELTRRFEALKRR